MTTTDTHPMPDTRCPAWCDADHESRWQQHVAAGLDTRPIPAAGGGFLPSNRATLTEWLEDWEPVHTRTLGSIDLGGRERAVVDIERGAEGDTFLYIDAQGAVTSEQARRYAAELLNAADMLDEVTAVQA